MPKMTIDLPTQLKLRCSEQDLEDARAVAKRLGFDELSAAMRSLVRGLAAADEKTIRKVKAALR